MESIIKKSIVLLLTISIFACDVDSNCNSVNVDFVTFSTVTLNANAEEQNVGVVFDSIVSPQTDDYFFLADTLSSFQLPLSPVENHTDFYFYSGTRGDTISFTYEKRNSVDSPECGFNIDFIGLDTAFQTFDSLVIVNDTLKRTVNAPNIKLFVF
ncbi:DUF6452 family protein [Marivirga harenae]|uniref:DUF6452 family protein n=1 Tax=Marivirga harenae TaxID=2010992 RepID=UPI0026E065EF|nr:DUF6452 family protein [Marivirga harenae]WKV12915.1 DUF6452 family protein [Marivirga harenae]|tara:strand:+ start:62622 stop:63086 length:465 start_codon:yes stop_codon:yes gene_type:complete